jgi:phenylalanyl-tRNA synthetase beta subunit
MLFKRKEPEEFAIEPFVGAGSLKFGMSRDEIRKLLGKPFRTVNGMDQFTKLGITVNYNEDEKCNWLGFSDHPQSIVTFQGRQLLHVLLKDLRKWLKKLDSDLREDDTVGKGYLSLKFGILVGSSGGDYRKELDDLSHAVVLFSNDTLPSPADL